MKTEDLEGGDLKDTKVEKRNSERIKKTLLKLEKASTKANRTSCSSIIKELEVLRFLGAKKGLNFVTE